MLVHPEAAHLTLFEATDLESVEDGHLSKLLVGQGLPDTVGGALTEILSWARSYLAQPHSELGRKGDVCPFTGPSLDRGTFYLTPYPGVPSGEAAVAEALREYRDWFLTLDPVALPLSQFKTILVLFPDVPAADAPALIDRAQALLKPAYVEAGLMIGEFHDGPPEQGGLWNPDWRPLRSPVPLLAIRHMVPTDVLFLEHDPDLLASYLAYFSGAVPKHLRERTEAAAARHGLPPLPARPRRAVKDPLAGLTAEQKRVMLEELLSRDPSREFPPTSPQRRLWFIDGLEGDGSGVYNMPARVTLPAPADPDLVEQAVAVVTARHESLRTAFRDDSGEPVGVVMTADDASLYRPVPVRDLGPDSLSSLLAEPIPLDTAPLFRVELHRAPGEDQVLLSLHHIIADDASIAHVCKEIREAYLALKAGREPDLPPVVQFSDYARLVADEVARGSYEPHRAYWIGRLTGAPVLSLPTARPRPTEPTFRGASHAFEVDTTIEQVDAIARRSGTTRFVVLTAALKVVLAALSGEDDVSIGSPVGGRTVPGLHDCVGMFVNTVVLRTDLSGRPTLQDVLERTRTTVVGALDHQDLPFEQVTEDVAAPRALGVNPLFQTMLVLGRGDVMGTTVDVDGPDQPAPARFDLTVVAIDRPGKVGGWIDYSTDLFDPEQISAFAERLGIVLDAMATDATASWDSVDLRTRAERVARRHRSVRADDVVAAFRRTAEERPDALAVRVLGDAAETVTYGELEEWSARTAARLQRAGVRPGDVVAVDAIRSAGVVAALLGILRAGAAYLPLDPGHPDDRRRALMHDAGAVAVISDTSEVVWAECPVLSYDGPADSIPDAVLPATAPAYVIYTSGSTGTPKGVVVSRASLAGLARCFIDVHGLAPQDRLLAVPPFSFDASVGDVFPALVSGAALVLEPNPAGLTLPKLIEVAREYGVSAVDTASPLWQQWVAQLDDVRAGELLDGPLRMIWMGGEAVPTAAARAWRTATDGMVPLHNHYGPTEATVCATTHQVSSAQDVGPWSTIPVGTPLDGVAVHVLDSHLRPVPDGVLGEICIGGEGVAMGYVGRAGETAARFVPDPTVPGGRMYRTGDIGRWAPDGHLEFAGRRDQQVKIRGYRVEPGEVEGVISAHPMVAENAVLALDDPVLGRRLVAFVVAKTADLSHDNLEAYLVDQLPEHLVPSRIVSWERLPRTTGGKVDRAALRLSEPQTTHREHVDPATPTERAVARAWGDVLDLPQVSATDGYFDLGGHSLLAGRVLLRVQEECGVAVPLRVLFAAPDLRSFAADVDRLVAGQAPVGEQVDLHAAAVLPDDLQDAGSPARRARRPVERPVRPLLTGATGFVGAHLLVELLKNAEQVSCLVRAESPEAGLERVRRTVQRFGLPETGLGRVVPVLGNLAQPGLGLSDAARDHVLSGADAIFHVAAHVSSAHAYTHLAPTNVGGTLEVLRLAVEGGLPLHDVSTLGVFRTPSMNGRPVDESTSLPPDPDGIVGAYEQSKWVADRLVTAAAEAGVQGTVHRPARVAGSSRTGVLPDADLLPLLLQAIVETGHAPNLHSWHLDLTPVDHLVAAIASLADRPGVYHYLTPHPLPFDDLVTAFVEDGYAVEREALDDWYARLSRAQEQTGAYAVLTQEFSTNAAARAQPHFDCSSTEAAAADAGVTFPPPDVALIRRYLRHLRATDQLPDPPTRDSVIR